MVTGSAWAMVASAPVYAQGADAGFDAYVDGTFDAFGQAHKPQMVLAHQQVVERAVDAFEEQAHVAPIRLFRKSPHGIEHARRGPHVVARELGEVGNSVHGDFWLWRCYMRNRPNLVSSIGALRVAARPSASTRRVSAGSITPSSHRRAVA